MLVDFLLELLSRKLKQAGTRAPVGSGSTPSCEAVRGQAAGPSATLGKRSRGDEEVRVEEGLKKARVEEGDSSSRQRSGGDRSRKTDHLRRKSSLDEHDLALGEEESDSSSGPRYVVPPPVFETSSADQGAPVGEGGASDLGEAIFGFLFLFPKDVFRRFMLRVPSQGLNLLSTPLHCGPRRGPMRRLRPFFCKLSGCNPLVRGFLGLASRPCLGLLSCPLFQWRRKTLPYIC